MKRYFFPSVVLAAALALAAGAAFFTILGFQALFGESLRIIYMATTIEIGKIIAVSALYQFKDFLPWISKAVLVIMVAGAMLVTSAGVYGYLSSSYEKDTIEISQNQAKVELLESRQGRLRDRLEGIDQQIAEVPETYVTKRMELISTFKPERQSILEQLDQLEEQESNLRLERIDQEVEYGAIILIAQYVDGLDPDSAMLYFIILVIFIFDPLAIMLTHSANMAFAKISAKNKEEAVSSLNDEDGLTMEQVEEAIEKVRAESGEKDEAVLNTLRSITDRLDNIPASPTTSSNPRSGLLDD